MVLVRPLPVLRPYRDACIHSARVGVSGRKEDENVSDLTVAELEERYERLSGRYERLKERYERLSERCEVLQERIDQAKYWLSKIELDYLEDVMTVLEEE
jgi:archaellum component FlaC